MGVGGRWTLGQKSLERVRTDEWLSLAGGLVCLPGSDGSVSQRPDQVPSHFR